VHQYVPEAYSKHIGEAEGVASLAMVIHALHYAGKRETLDDLLQRVLALDVDVSGDAYGGWLASYQACGDITKELRVWEHMAKTAPSLGLRVATGNMYVIRMFELGMENDASAALTQMYADGLTNAVSDQLLQQRAGKTSTGLGRSLGWKPRLRSEGVRQARAAGRILQKFDYYKEVGVLDYVFSRASCGDSGSVCRAIEAFSNEEHLYIKLSAEEKGLALDMMLTAVGAAGFLKPPLVVEVGCYVGYSAVRVGTMLPKGGLLVTMEVDPYHAAIARSVLELSGVSGAVEVWIGHSEQLIPRLVPRFGLGSMQAIYFDQKGTRYHEDLELLESSGILAHGAFVCADNVVRPGAPEFMWRVCDPSGPYETQAIAHRDYGQDSVEDWISISRFCGPQLGSCRTGHSVFRPCPASLKQLAYDSDQIRNRSVNERVTEEEWRVFATRVRHEYEQAGICPPVRRPEGSSHDLHVELLQWMR